MIQLGYNPLPEFILITVNFILSCDFFELSPFLFFARAIAVSFPGAVNLVKDFSNMDDHADRYMWERQVMRST